MNEKNFEKITFKIVISIQQCTPVPNFSYLGETQILGQNLPTKEMNDKNFEKINNKFRIGIEQCTPVPNFR